MKFFEHRVFAKAFAIVLISCILIMLCFASAEETQHSDQFSCDYFTIELPDGISTLQDSESYIAAMQNDYSGSYKACLVASDAAQVRCVTVLRREMKTSAIAAAKESAVTLLGSSDTVIETDYGNNKCGEFSCSIDQLEYNYCYFADKTSVYCVVSVGLRSDEISAMAESFTSKEK